MPTFSRLPSPSAHATWPDLPHARAVALASRPAFRFLQSGETVTATLSYAELERHARAIAVVRREHCAPGDRALLRFPSSLDFQTASFGCLYAGGVAVPAYPPRANESVHRLRAIGADAGAHLALTTATLRATSQQRTPATLGDDALRFLTTDDLSDPAALAARWTRPATLAFRQYTPGSTGQPKGVMLTHAHLLANAEMIRRVYRHTGDDVIAGWLPLLHDRGLIGLAMPTLDVGATCLLLPPAAFLQKPLRWLRLRPRHRGTTTGGPNFADELCARRITAAERADLDLASLRIAFNGSEPIPAATLDLFATTVAPGGFRRDALLPCYGMAEASLLVTGKTRGRPLVPVPFDPAQLAPAAPSAPPPAARSGAAVRASAPATATAPPSSPPPSPPASPTRPAPRHRRPANARLGLFHQHHRPRPWHRLHQLPRHVIGRRRHATEDDSRNSFILSLLTLGEGWHHHHRYQSSTRNSFYWWEIDPTYDGLKLLSWTGLIWNLKGVPASALDEGRRADASAPPAAPSGPPHGPPPHPYQWPTRRARAVRFLTHRPRHRHSRPALPATSPPCPGNQLKLELRWSRNDSR